MGLLVAIEGIDGSGKGTQAQRLVDALGAAGYRPRLLSFPRYTETAFGRRIAEFLNGRYGALREVHPLFPALLFAGDRYESRRMLLDAISVCDVLILDRYVGSNIAHQAAKVHGTEREELASWIEQLEHGIYELPRPDLVVLLDLPVAQAQELISRKSPRSYTQLAADLQEQDGLYLEEVRELYLSLAHRTSGWRIVEVAREGRVRPVAEIGDEVFSLVTAELRRRGIAPAHGS